MMKRWIRHRVRTKRFEFASLRKNSNSHSNSIQMNDLRVQRFMHTYMSPHTRSEFIYTNVHRKRKFSSNFEDKLKNVKDNLNDMRYSSYAFLPAIPVAFIVFLCILAGDQAKKDGKKVMSEVKNAEKTREVCLRYVNSGKEEEVLVKGFPVNKTTDWYSKFSHIGQKYTLDFSGGTYWDSYVGDFVGEGFEVQEKYDRDENASFRVRGGVFNLKTRRFAWVQDYKVHPPLVVLCSATCTDEKCTHLIGQYHASNGEKGEIKMKIMSDSVRERREPKKEKEVKLEDYPDDLPWTTMFENNDAKKNNNSPWSKLYHKGQNRHYYWNRDTGETTWEKPKGY